MKLKHKQNPRQNQGGFSILGAVLVVVGIIAAIAVWAMSGSSNMSTAGSSAGNVQATTLMNDSQSIFDAYNGLVANGSTATTIVYVPNTASTAAAPNVLDPTTGIANPIVAGVAVSSSTFPSGAWIYAATGFTPNGLGTPGAADPAMVVAGIKDSVCQQINSHLYNSTAIPASGIASSTFTGGATAAAPTAAATATIPATAALGWQSGCVATTDGTDKNVYYRVLKIN